MSFFIRKSLWTIPNDLRSVIESSEYKGHPPTIRYSNDRTET